MCVSIMAKYKGFMRIAQLFELLTSKLLDIITICSAPTPAPNVPDCALRDFLRHSDKSTRFCTEVRQN